MAIPPQNQTTVTMWCRAKNHMDDTGALNWTFALLCQDQNVMETAYVITYCVSDMSKTEEKTPKPQNQKRNHNCNTREENGKKRRERLSGA